MQTEASKNAGVLDYIASDMRRKRMHYVRIDNFINKYLKITFQLGTIAAVVYRFDAALYRHRVPLLTLPFEILYKVLSYLSSMMTGVDVNPATSIGRGFVIHNFSNIAINAESVGENLTVNQGVNIGPDWRMCGKPVLGDNVFVGSGAKILGNVTVGNNVIIAANALVERSIPDDCTVVGVPARIVSRNSDSQYLKMDANKSANNGNSG